MNLLLAQILVVMAAYVFLLMGVVHGALTFRDLKHPRAFTPRDAALRPGLEPSGLARPPAINLWDAWLGFSLTHSLGLVLFGGGYLCVGIFEPQVFAQSCVLQSTAVLVSALYLVVSLRVFFARPALGCALGLCGFMVATALAHA